MQHRIWINHKMFGLALRGWLQLTIIFIIVFFSELLHQSFVLQNVYKIMKNVHLKFLKAQGDVFKIACFAQTNNLEPSDMKLANQSPLEVHIQASSGAFYHITHSSSAD